MAGETDGAGVLLGVGHSHLSTLLKAWQIRRKEGLTGGREAFFARLNHPSFQPNFETEKGVRRLTPALVQRLRHMLRVRAPDAVICVLMGNEYNSMAMVRHPRPYDFDWPEQGLSADPGCERIAFAMMKAQLAALARRNALLFWQTIAAVASCPVYLVPPPPPIRSEAHILAHPGKFRDMAARYGVNPPDFRRKMWQLYCAVLREAVTGSMTEFVELPAAIYDDGFLAEGFWSHDPTHANPAYGEILLSEIEGRVFTARSA